MSAASQRPDLYSPLVGKGAFRLLDLLPGAGEAPIHCHLRPTDLASASGTYEAMSYTWGPPWDKPTITCNGSPLEIQKNAFAMLKVLRHPSDTRVLWVDAICIDQTNDNEKSQQVGMMSEIYRDGARQVTVWLGEADDASRAALRYASELDVDALRKEIVSQSTVLGPKNAMDRAEAMQHKTYFFDQFEDNSSNISTVTGGKTAADLEQLAMDIGNFLQREYFSRVWIQQEVRLAPDDAIEVYCGTETCSWDRIWALAWIMLPRSPGAYPGFADDMYVKLMGNLRAVYYIQAHRLRRAIPGRQPRQEPWLFDQLGTYRDLGATNPSDKVYALLNLVSDADTWIDRVDYKIPWQLLYLSIARDALTCGDMASILENAGRSRHDKDSAACPSWMPDFRMERETDYLIQPQAQWRPDRSIYINTLHTKKQLLANPPFATLHALPKRMHIRRVPDVPEQVRLYKGPLKSLFQSYVSCKCYMADEITYIGKAFDDMPKSIPVNVRIADTAELDLEHARKTMSSSPTRGPEWRDHYYLSGETVVEAFKLTCMLGRDGTGEYWREGTRCADDAVREGRNITERWDEWITWLRRVGQDPYAKYQSHEDDDDKNNDNDEKVDRDKKWEPQEKQPSHSRPSLLFDATTSQYAFHFRFVTTRNGYFCLVPGIAEVGDEVALISGYVMPIIVRTYESPSSSLPSNNSGPGSNNITISANEKKNNHDQVRGSQMIFHEFIGDAYVHGAMQGEISNIMGVFPCRHDPTLEQRSKLNKMLKDAEYDGWKMLGLSSGYEQVLGTIGMRELRLA